MKSVLTKSQKKEFVKFYTEGGTKYRITAELRYDDECGNGHNTFAITGSIERQAGGRWIYDAGGCIHDEIAKHFPQFQPLIKWHLCASDGPMHYIANTAFHASNRDCWGNLKGEPKDFETHIFFGEFPIQFHLGPNHTKYIRTKVQDNSILTETILEVPHGKKDGDSYDYGSKFTFSGYTVDGRPPEWHECQFDTKDEAEQFLEALKYHHPYFEDKPTAWGEGKERDFKAARECAIWPEATDEELSADDLKERLKARLPKLLKEFKAAMEGLGFIY